MPTLGLAVTDQNADLKFAFSFSFEIQDLCGVDETRTRDGRTNREISAPSIQLSLFTNVIQNCLTS